MGKLNNLRAKMADEFEISEEVTTDIPRVSVIGKNKVIIENHKSIMGFDRNNVKISTAIGNIVIIGADFEVLFMGENTIVISGIFNSLNYEGES